MDHESVQATALKVVFDLLHVYGFEAFNITSSSSSPSNTDPEGGGGAEGDSQPEQGAPEGAQEGGGAEEGLEEEEEGEKEKLTENGITHKLLNIMASFLEGEVSTNWKSSFSGSFIEFPGLYTRVFCFVRWLEGGSVSYC